MKYIIIILCALCISCNTHSVQEYIEYEEIYCPKCDGIGKVKMSTGSRVALGIITFGCGALVETTECDMCNGTGIVKRRKLNN